jgi:drug/metabolite transporter (DMT)-like permease
MADPRTDGEPVPGSRARLRTVVLAALAMVAFAGNSLLCRLALRHTPIDPGTFTAIRIASGAAALGLLARLTARASRVEGSWPSALALVAYAVAFSFAYVTLPAATGALLLFGAVQATMIGVGLIRGDRLVAWQWLGLALSLAGLVGLNAPGLTAPPPGGAALMLSAGVAWGIYSLRGRGAGHPTAVTAGNFLRATPIAIVVALLPVESRHVDAHGAAYAIASGALASGVGYAIWYAAIPGLRPATAAVVQLSVPVIAALGGLVFLGEAVTFRLIVAATAILGGIAIVIGTRRR